MTSALPALLVTVPLFCAPLCLLLHNPALSRLLALAATIFCLLCGFSVLTLTYEGEALVYNLGGWPPPWGIAYRASALSGLLATLMAALAALVLCGAHISLAKESPNLKINHFYALFLVCFSGLLGIVVTNDIFNLFVFLEISSLSSYALIASAGGRFSTIASFRYLIAGSIGATFFLIGVSLIYFITGALNLDDIAERLPNVDTHSPIYAAYAFIAAGLALKFALFPAHQWLPAAYTSAPSPVTTFISATSTKVALYVFIILFSGTFSSDRVLSELSLGYALLALSSVAIIYGSATAFRQSNIKRMMAWSSVAQIGYIALGIGLATEKGISAAIIHIFNHSLIKSGLFFALACVAYRLKSCYLKEMEGLAKRMPWTSATIVICGLSLAGIPLSVGFISKWYLIEATIDSELWIFAVVILLGSLISLAYIWRFVEVAYFKQPSQRVPQATEAPLALLAPTWILAAANIFFGLYAEPITLIAAQTAKKLMAITL